jgi:hypothetical protein
MSRKKIVPVLRYCENGALRLEIGRRSYPVFESLDEFGKPFSQEGLAGAIGPLIVGAFNSLTETQRLRARQLIDEKGPDRT